jgi:hypothetical protein
MPLPSSRVPHWIIAVKRSNFVEPWDLCIETLQCFCIFFSQQTIVLNAVSLTTSIEQCPSWETNSRLASQEILRLSRNPKVHHRVHKNQPPVPILSQINPIDTLSPYLIRTLLILSSRLLMGFPSAVFPSGFRTKIVYAFLICPCVLHAPPILSSFI